MVEGDLGEKRKRGRGDIEYELRLREEDSSERMVSL
jgi:hypothetical protein